jgi:transposase
MLLTRLLNACHHFPGFVYYGARLCEAAKTIEIDVRPRQGSKPCCSGCNKPAAGYDQLRERRFEFIPIWGFAVVLLYCMRRVDCRDCGVKVETVPWGIGKHTLCKAYMWYLAHWARKLSWKETAQSFHTSWEKVVQAVEYVVQWGLEHRQLGPLRAIGVDEIQYGRGHQYLTLVYQIEAGCVRLLWVGKERTQESFEQFFTMIGKPLAENGYEPVLKKSRWCLLKRRENLTDKQRVKLRDLLGYNLKSVRAYLLKECFQQFWDYDSPTWAGKFLDQWCMGVMRSRLDPLKKFARTVRNHRELLLNYFRARKAFSSGIIEGLNNKAKVTMRKAYGYRTFKMAELSLYHVLGKLPEPKLTHSFY